MTDTDVLAAELTFETGQFGLEVNRVSPQTRKYLQVGFENGDIYYWTEQTLYRFDRDITEYETFSTGRQSHSAWSATGLLPPSGNGHSRRPMEPLGIGWTKWRICSIGEEFLAHPFFWSASEDGSA